MGVACQQLAFERRASHSWHSYAVSAAPEPLEHIGMYLHIRVPSGTTVRIPPDRYHRRV